MPDFLYRAKTAAGQNTDGVISAGSHREALSLLTRQALFPLEVRDQATAGGSFKLPIQLSRKVKAEIIADTLTQLADLLANGVALLESLRILAEQSTDKRMCEVLGEVCKDVENGANLDDALAVHPEIFSPLTVNMVRAGLEGAFLEESLERIASFMRKHNELRGKVISAMTYPILLAIVGSIVAVVLIVLVVPMFESFFDRLERSGVGLPIVTLILLAISDTLTRYGVFVGLGLAGLVVLARKYMATERGTRWLDRVKLRIPVAGSIFHDTAVSRFCRILGTLLRNGVPILKSLDISSASAGNTLLQEAIKDSAVNISSGNLLSQPLATSGLIPAQVMAMIRVAEESNTLDQVLVKISDRMDQKIERRLEMMVRLIEPIMLLTIGGLVMFIIVGVLLPIIDLNSAID
ncbi:MAG: type II secretion system F family protein [Pirellulaceae bacterium]|jgi:general secretion pathway protein F/type IV pilus assembly protein PilC|nr:type II secretion system F family protein [Pirellulaceae bacterium]HJN09333.1 type II secretion system F family protein [Pirellulaceae bacterium]